ncbi:GDSL-type esterase/lipase family protein [Siminovitchia sediminis]|uniref:GDSL-type esterase/lipase family protein n=1 Tax=Siminovitchia sediminis TaxID=1274353 RepID=A0ABW4KHD4_9BACI
MNTKMKRILYISIAVNILLVLLIVLPFLKNDTADAVVQKLNGVQRLQFHSYERTTLFDELPIPTDATVFLGDSLTFRTEWSELFPEKTVINRGIGGDTTEGVLERLDDVTQADPKQIFLLIGVNDLKRKSVASTIHNYERIVQRIQTESPETELFIQSLLPVDNHKYGDVVSNDKIRQLNKELRLLAEDFGVTFIDLYSVFEENGQLPEMYTADGIHLTGKGYILWRETIKEYVR